MWKDIESFEGRYEVSDVGEIRNAKTYVLLKLKLDKDGYHQIGLRKLGDRKKYWFYVHKLVALAFLGYKEGQVDHIDTNKLNNSVSNLRWVTQHENALNRQLKPWSTNVTTRELYITKYPNGYMLRINRKDYIKKMWFKDISSAIIERDACLRDIESLNLALGR